MDKFEFMNEIKEVLEKLDDKTLLNNKEDIKKIVSRMIDMEYEYAKNGIR